MATSALTQSQAYDIIKSVIESEDGDFSDFNEGSMLDIISGAMSTASNEIMELVISEFKKTYFETAHGPEVTGSVDDLQNLAVDHYSETFKRPEASKSSGSVTFSRPNADAGNVDIPQDTVVKTEKDSEGQEILFKTKEQVTMTGLSISVEVEASVAGKSGNVESSKIVVIDSNLTDSSITVSNPFKMAGGAETQSDAEYRETIRNLIKSLAGATKAAIEGIVKSVPSVSIATLIERERVVIDYDIANSQPVSGASFFRIPYPVIYVADSSGSSSQSMIDAVVEAVRPVRACGVRIEVLGAIAIPLSWDASYILNASGPNFSELQNDFSKITDSMSDFINSIDIGGQFSITEANAYILSIWGPSGTGDIDAFNTNSPVTPVAVNANEKIIPNVMSINGATP